MITRIPLDRHPAYKRLKEKLSQEGAATGRFLSFIGLNNGDFHITDRLHDKEDDKSGVK